MNKNYFQRIRIDQEVIADFVNRHPQMKKFIKEDDPIHFRKCTQHFPGLLHSIISQGSTSKDVLEITKGFDDLLNSEITVQKVLALGEAKLKELLRSEDKAKLVILICNDIINNKLNLQELAKRSSDENIKVLSQYPCINMHTIKEYLIFTCTKPDIFCVEDYNFMLGVYRYLQKRDWTEQDIYNIKDEYKGEETLFSICMWVIRFTQKGPIFMSNIKPITTVIKQELVEAINKFNSENPELKVEIDPSKISVDKTRNSKFGDFTTNYIMSLDVKGMNKRELANKIATYFDKRHFDKVEVAGPGFINFFINKETRLILLNEITNKGDEFGKFDKKNKWYNIEFVSANPTGLLHIGHARNGAYGDSLARIFETYGIRTDREYYINDGGNQIRKLALSVLIRYLQSFGKNVQLPEDSYHAQEIIDCANSLKAKYGDKFVDVKYNNDFIIDEKANDEIGMFAKTYMLDIIKDHLAKLGVVMDLWSPESYIYENHLIDKAFKQLGDKLYDADGAKWLKTTLYGDDKDRVLVKSDGNYTYFTPDIAYHNLKLGRGYTKIFNIWGADHKSYVDRMSCAIQMLGYKKEQMHVCIMQMVALTKNGEEFKMSKRSGNSFTTIDLINLIGKDAARWYLVNQSLDSHITIDVEKAGKKNNENGLFYVQYAYVRIKKILSTSEIKPVNKVDLLTKDIEKELINQLFFFMPTIENVANSYEVHKICLYLTNLAKLFHTYYESVKINDADNKELTAQRLFLINAVATVIKNGLKLIGVDVVENM